MSTQKTILKLQFLREEKGLSQTDVAKLLGVTRQAYSRYERGERELGYASLRTLAKVFDVSIDFMLGLSDYYYPDKVKAKAADLSQDEQQLLHCFRELPGSSQSLILSMVKSAADAAKRA